VHLRYVQDYNMGRLDNLIGAQHVPGVSVPDPVVLNCHAFDPDVAQAAHAAQEAPGATDVDGDVDFAMEHEEAEEASQETSAFHLWQELQERARAGFMALLGAGGRDVQEACDLHRQFTDAILQMSKGDLRAQLGEGHGDFAEFGKRNRRGGRPDNKRARAGYEGGRGSRPSVVRTRTAGSSYSSGVSSSSSGSYIVVVVVVAVVVVVVVVVVTAVVAVLLMSRQSPPSPNGAEWASRRLWLQRQRPDVHPRLCRPPQRVPQQTSATTRLWHQLGGARP
jgi:hypothetical protein